MRDHFIAGFAELAASDERIVLLTGHLHYMVLDMVSLAPSCGLQAKPRLWERYDARQGA